jgi:hypothetical protein
LRNRVLFQNHADPFERYVHGPWGAPLRMMSAAATALTNACDEQGFPHILAQNGAFPDG